MICVPCVNITYSEDKHFLYSLQIELQIHGNILFVNLSIAFPLSDVREFWKINLLLLWLKENTLLFSTQAHTEFSRVLSVCLFVCLPGHANELWWRIFFTPALIERSAFKAFIRTLKLHKLKEKKKTTKKENTYKSDVLKIKISIIRQKKAKLYSANKGCNSYTSNH